MRPLGREGVLRPAGTETVDAEGGPRPNEGVSRPLRIDATEEGRDALLAPTVGRDSLSALMKTPHFGGHVKYFFLQATHKYDARMHWYEQLLIRIQKV